MNENLNTVRDYVAGHAKLDPALLAGESFVSLVDARIGHHGLSGPAAYLDLLRRSSGEVELFVGEIAVPETWLFRYPQSYELLARWLTARRHDRPSGSRLRMLSVGCATGEEPCSMAITAVHAGWPPAGIEIDALDRRGGSTAASGGQFGLRSLRPDMPVWARRWLQIADRQVDVDPVVASRIRYLHADVFNWLASTRRDVAAAAASCDRAASAQGPGRLPTDASAPYDVIFCRNLLIYLTRAAGVRMLRGLAESLARDGLLFVGHAELWLAPPEVLVPLATPHTFALRRAGPPMTVATSDAAAQPATGTAATRIGVASRTAAAVVGPGSGTRHDLPCGPAIDPPAEPAVAGTMAAPPATLEMTRELANRGDLAQALVSAEAILAREGPDVELLELLGSLQLALNRLEPASDSFRKVIYLDPNHAKALLQLAMISQRRGDDDQAERYRLRAGRAHHGTTRS